MFEQWIANEIIFTQDLIISFLYNYRFQNIYGPFVKYMKFILQLYEKVALLLTNLGKWNPLLLHSTVEWSGKQVFKDFFC